MQAAATLSKAKDAIISDGRIDETALDQLFREARTHNEWQARPVPDELLRDVVDLAKMAPTSANASPLRIVFVRTKEGKERLKAALGPMNVEKTMAAPVTAIIGHDLAFHDLLPRLFPHADARAWFVGNEPLIESTAFRNGTLQGAYFMLAARAVGLDVGGMSGFDNAKVDAEFFPDGRIKSNFLCNIGHGDPSKVMPKLARLDFDEACTLL
jgi:3-hydroxypropanoate dehydrogenase